MTTLQQLVNLLDRPPRPLPNPLSACKNCWDTPGLDVNCGGQIETCRYCNGTGRRPRKGQVEMTGWLNSIPFYVFA